LPHVSDQLHAGSEAWSCRCLPALPGQVEDHLEREQGLSRTRLAGDQVDGSGGDPPSEDAIESGLPVCEELQVGLALGQPTL